MSIRLGRSVGVSAAIALIVAGGTFGASRSSTLASTRLAQQNHAMVNVHFILNWIPNVEFAGLWVAQQKGWWKQAGINMTYTPYSISVHPETDVLSYGGNAFGFQSSAAIIIAKSKGVPIRALYTDTQRSVFGLSVLDSSHINKITDLKGKRVGYQPHEFYVPATMLAHAGLKPTDWKPVQVGFNTDQLTQGQVDAYLVFLNNEPIALKLAGVKVHSFAAADYGFQAYDDVMFAPNALIKSNPALVKKVTAIVARGFAWAHTHHPAATNITVNGPFKSYVAKNGGRQQQLLELKAFDQFSKDAHGKFSGLMTAAVWRATTNTLFKYGEIKTKPAVASMFTNQFNPNK
jgi:ABC-type nitrate/sulfonate/bicarbonate transport system substrate-binding protein